MIRRDRMKFAVLGAGGHGKVVYDAALASGMGDIIGFIDDDLARVGTQLMGAPVLGPLEKIGAPNELVLLMGIGDNGGRRRAFEHARHLGYRVSTVIHPTAIIGRECE